MILIFRKSLQNCVRKKKRKKEKDVPSTCFLSSKTRFFLHSFHSAPMMPIRFFCEDKFFFVHRASGEVIVK